jgi:hypothetical protein
MSCSHLFSQHVTLQEILENKKRILTMNLAIPNPGASQAILPLFDLMHSLKLQYVPFPLKPEFQLLSHAPAVAPIPAIKIFRVFFIS